ncbi:MAG TPA: hypothetical protein PK295_03155 [Candidatus Magasanikbacteria bacterium]|nr:hypothetical protein [Candidatus Magasanikbacteria bacterium]
MTYALAWKTKRSVFLAADTAITTTGDDVDKLDIEVSSFGRKHFLEIQKGKKVEERVVKVFSSNNVGIIFAGSHSHARQIASDVFIEIENGKTAKEALQVAIFKTIVPPQFPVQLAIGYYDSEPKIIFFDSSQGGIIQENLDEIQMGNPPRDFQNETKRWLVDIETGVRETRAQLVALLGILQSFNLLNDTLRMGIGGICTGLTIDKDGCDWQPDILFIEYGNVEKHVGTCFRNDCLVVNSPIIGQSRCFASTFLPLTSPVLMGKVKKAINKASILKATMEYEYVVILSHKNNSLTILEMRRNTKHDLLWFESLKDSDATKIYFFPKLKKILNEKNSHNGLTYIQYEEPSIKFIPEENRTHERIIDYNE